LKALRSIHHEQSGFTLVEMIVTMALVTVVTGGMVSTFAIFDSVQTAWRDRNQARAVSVVAEEAIARDAGSYRVVGCPQVLCLQPPSDGNGSTFTVSYSVNRAKNGLVRTVTDQLRRVVELRVVEHGITAMTASCKGHPGVVHVVLSVVASGSRPQDPAVLDEPGFDVSSRNPGGSGC
jgi:prepilin-type N-terminal cleavage/methylation domain-containing protein